MADDRKDAGAGNRGDRVAGCRDRREYRGLLLGPALCAATAARRAPRGRFLSRRTSRGDRHLSRRVLARIPRFAGAPALVSRSSRLSHGVAQRRRGEPDRADVRATRLWKLFSRSGSATIPWTVPPPGGGRAARRRARGGDLPRILADAIPRRDERTRADRTRQ